MKRTQLITTADLTKQEVEFFMKEADRLRGKTTKDLAGKIVASLFFEPSTRTRLSFESAALRLGAQCISVANASSTSMKKGETLEDTIKVIEKYADILVMRHPKEGAAAQASHCTAKPLLNAGDGANQHPTQALLDLYTIKRECGRIDGLTIAFVGDLKFGRTVHSLIPLLAQYKVKLMFISPEQLKIPNHYLDHLKKAKVPYREDSELNKHVPQMDVLYMTRIQQERFENLEEYYFLKGSYILTSDVVRLGKKSMRVLHPLPRIDEITVEVDRMEDRAAYFRQVENGVFMRMALLKHLSKNYYG